MPIIRNTETDETFEWLSNSFVGRGLQDGLSFDEHQEVYREVSSIHAAVIWNRNERAWFVHDLGSRNGTFIDGQQVAGGKGVALRQNSTLLFGRLSFEVVDLSAPPARAICRRTRQIALESDGIILIPNESNPVITLARGTYGWTRYDAERDPDAPIPPTDLIRRGDIIEVDDHRWEFWQASSADKTAFSKGSLAMFGLVFEVSANYDTITMTLQADQRTIRVPPRRHTEMLWLLARARLDDLQAGVAAKDAGWRLGELLASDMGMRTNDPSGNLNIQVFRARRQLADLGIDKATGLIERRRGALRIGTDRLHIIEGAGL